MNPVSLFGGCYECAVIDSEGGIIYIGNSHTQTIKPVFHPEGEKAINLAFCYEPVISLSSNCRLFDSKKGNLSFKEVSKKKGIEIVSISGTLNHCIAVSKEGRALVHGKDGLGEGILSLGKDMKNVKKFTEIPSLCKYKITSLTIK